MFTGLITVVGSIFSFIDSILTIDAPSSFWDRYPIGSSIAVHGTCLTLIKKNNNLGSFMVMLETLNRTIFKNIKIKDRVHLEGSLENGSRIDGHLISGHVHGTIYLINRIDNPDGSRILKFLSNNKLIKFKDSISLNGVSLTISAVSSNSFQVSCIPHTLSVTTLGDLTVGDEVNVEYNTPPKEISEVDPMELAYTLSKRGKSTAPSNPWVGCVIVKDNQIISSGYHRCRGEPHAERNALMGIPEEMDLQTSTLYCTLEPCNHIGLQPPCTDIIIKRKIKNVVVGILDPDGRVAGNGIKKLTDNNINVTVLNNLKIKNSLRSYIWHRQTQLPYVIGKVVISMDGKMGRIGIRTQISNPDSSSILFKLRRNTQAVIIGATTALTDNPQLTIRPNLDEKRPIRYRVVIDGSGKCGLPENRIRITYLWDNPPGYQTLMVTSEKCPEEIINWYKINNIKYLILPLNNGLMDLLEILKYLGSLGVLSVLVEGGKEVHERFWNSNLYNEIRIIQSGTQLGSSLGETISGPEFKNLKFINTKTKIIGDINPDIYRIYKIK